MSNPITPLDPEQTIRQEHRAVHEHYPVRVLVALDQFANVLSGGKPDETISSRSARAAAAGNRVGIVVSRILNFFQRDHGAKAQAGDAARGCAVATTEQKSGDINHG